MEVGRTSYSSSMMIRCREIGRRSGWYGREEWNERAAALHSSIDSPRAHPGNLHLVNIKLAA